MSKLLWNISGSESSNFNVTICHAIPFSNRQKTNSQKPTARSSLVFNSCFDSAVWQNWTWHVISQVQLICYCYLCFHELSSIVFMNYYLMNCFMNCSHWTDFIYRSHRKPDICFKEMQVTLLHSCTNRSRSLLRRFVSPTKLAKLVFGYNFNYDRNQGFLK